MRIGPTNFIDLLYKKNIIYCIKKIEKKGKNGFEDIRI